jgi:hypothetical protein
MTSENIAQDPIIHAWRNIYGKRLAMETLLFHFNKDVSEAARFYLVCHNHIETIMSFPPEEIDTIH